MFKNFLIALSAILMIGMTSPAVAEGFSIVVEDLPIMDGMTEREDLTVVFDTPEGRIVETTMETAAGVETVLSYYRRTLTQLGWHPVGTSERAYIRENEMLSIDAKKNPAAEAYGAANAVIVSFKISPRK